MDFTCSVCAKSFVSQSALSGHMASHSKNGHGATNLRNARISEYNKKPKLCANCNKPLPYDKGKSKDSNTFCNRSCAASYNNKGVSRRANVYTAVGNACKYCHKAMGRVPLAQLFCSSTCMQSNKRAERVALWLDTGVANPDSHKGHYVREYVMHDQNNKCAICGHPPLWEAKPIVFILDHVSGDSADNRRENLRLVCPNCDSQLDTYKAKNKGNGRHSRRKRYADGKSY